MGRIKINLKYLPIKAHYFFYLGAMGPIYPFVNVYGKQLGISPAIMGIMSAVLPVLFLITKVSVGYAFDNYRAFGKYIFIGLVPTTSFAFLMMYFLPNLPGLPIAEHKVTNVTIVCNELITCDLKNISKPEECYGEKSIAMCHWYCENGNNFSASVIFEDRRKDNFSNDALCLVEPVENLIGCNENHAERTCGLTCKPVDEDQCFYRSLTFWGFLILACIGSTFGNVTYSITNVICFDVLGPGNESKYGRQRLWGTLAYGATAFLSGYVEDLWSQGQTTKTYEPAFILMLVFTCLDVLCYTKLKVPIIPHPDSIVKSVYGVLKTKSILIFLFFAIQVGILNSFILNYMFWYIEDLAVVTGHIEQIKLIEGLIVASTALGGEGLFFALSGEATPPRERHRITFGPIMLLILVGEMKTLIDFGITRRSKVLKTLGYGYSFAFSFVCFALRFTLISLVPNPWWVVLTEFFMAGPSYALSCMIILAIASVIAPPGTTATVQGVITGMDDIFGLAVGSFIGGLLYKRFGGVISLNIFSGLAMTTAVLYFFVYATYLKHIMPKNKSSLKELKSSNVEWKSPEEATRACDNADAT